MSTDVPDVGVALFGVETPRPPVNADPHPVILTVDPRFTDDQGREHEAYFEFKITHPDTCSGDVDLCPVADYVQNVGIDESVTSAFPEPDHLSDDDLAALDGAVRYVVMTRRGITYSSPNGVEYDCEWTLTWSDSACPATYAPSRATSDQRDPVSCARDEAGHIGDHHGYEVVHRLDGEGSWIRLWAWSDGGGARGFTADGTKTATPCTRCGTPHDRNPAMRGKDADLDVCFGCILWDRHAAEYGSATTTQIRPHGDHGPFDGPPYLYGWASADHRRTASGTGGFGGRKYIVTFDDGRVYGPDSRLWSSGQIPWWRLDEFPPNGTIEPEVKPGSFNVLDLTGATSR